LDNYLASKPTPAKPSGDHIPLGGFVLERTRMANDRIVTIELRDVPSSIQDFVERHEGHTWRQLTLWLF
jgi:hypothetical protein